MHRQGGPIGRFPIYSRHSGLEAAEGGASVATSMGGECSHVGAGGLGLSPQQEAAEGPSAGTLVQAGRLWQSPCPQPCTPRQASSKLFGLHLKAVRARGLSGDRDKLQVAASSGAAPKRTRGRLSWTICPPCVKEGEAAFWPRLRHSASCMLTLLTQPPGECCQSYGSPTAHEHRLLGRDLPKAAVGPKGSLDHSRLGYNLPEGGAHKAWGAWNREGGEGGLGDNEPPVLMPEGILCALRNSSMAGPQNSWH